MITLKQVKEAVREKYTFPGMYPLYLIADDCEAICVECGRKEYRNIAYAHIHKQKDGWQIQAVDVNWDDNSLYCAHCGKQIESAYGEAQVESEVAQ